MKKLWFKAKNYGWGWYPASWEGWTVIGGYLLLLFGITTFFRNATDSEVAFTVIPLILLITVLLIYICYKTGEKPEWKWGKKK